MERDSVKLPSVGKRLLQTTLLCFFKYNCIISLRCLQHLICKPGEVKWNYGVAENGSPAMLHLPTPLQSVIYSGLCLQGDTAQHKDVSWATLTITNSVLTRLSSLINAAPLHSTNVKLVLSVSSTWEEAVFTGYKQIPAQQLIVMLQLPLVICTYILIFFKFSVPSPPHHQQTKWQTVRRTHVIF